MSMSPSLALRDLLAYTTWQRSLWQQWFADRGPDPLAVTTGPHGDGRFPTIGSLIRHIFSAELRYLERLAGLPLTDVGGVPTDDPAALFRFGADARARFDDILDTWPAAEWDRARDISILSATARLTPRKIALHVLTHEIRHWAQVATLLRLQGWTAGRQDLLVSPVLGDPLPL
jgi:uncharacterized damage-inducible protein DinB